MTGPDWLGEYVVTSTSLPCGMTMRTASLSTCCPAGMMIAVLPPKVSRRMVSALAAAVSEATATAMEAWVTVSADWP